MYSDFVVPFVLRQIFSKFSRKSLRRILYATRGFFRERTGWKRSFHHPIQSLRRKQNGTNLEPGVVPNDVDSNDQNPERTGWGVDPEKTEAVEIADPDTVPPVLESEASRRARRSKLMEAVDGYEIDETVTEPRKIRSVNGSTGELAEGKPHELAIHHPETEPVNLTDSTGGFSDAKSDAIDSGIVEDAKGELNAGVTSLLTGTAGEGIELLEQHPADEPEYEFPSLDLLDPAENFDYTEFESEAKERAAQLERYIKEFGFTVAVREIQLGPTITQYQVEPEQGLRVSKIASLADDLAVKLGVSNVRIVYPLLGKQNLVGIEIPNVKKQLVRMREVMEQLAGKYNKMSIPVFLGKDVAGKPLMADLATLPHLLIAGRTGTGKSVCLNSIIASIIMTRSPKDVRMLMVDPKMVEMSQYREIPHLMHPVVTDMKKAEAILAWAVEKMEDRYRWLARAGVRHMKDYNKMDRATKIHRVKPQAGETMPETMPFIVIIVDEMADLMMTAPKDVESHIIRLAQKSRAVGIHLILATQKPIVSVITSLIKSNLPARIAFQVSSKTDSRVVLDENGADRLLGHGDMLFLLPGTSTLIRAQGTYLSDDEIYRIVAAIATGEPQFETEIEQHLGAGGGGKLAEWAKRDELYTSAIDIIVSEGRGSISLLQRMLGIGYGRSARLIDFMEEDGIVGAFKGYTKPREVLLKKEDWEAMKAEFEKEQGSAIQAEIDRARAEAAMKEIEAREAERGDEDEEFEEEWDDSEDSEEEFDEELDDSVEDFDDESEDFDDESDDSDEDLFREESEDEGEIPPWDGPEKTFYPLPSRPVERSRGRSRRRITPNYEKIRTRNSEQDPPSEQDVAPEPDPEPEDSVNSPESRDVLNRIQPNQPKPFLQDGEDHFREIK
ncbi:MAG: DNA translocase FtsK [Thermoguttaceae bacterium]|nr:DNA translocase FtsK [Thermoguttaceae bacterium]